MKYSLNLTNLLIWPYLLSTNALASLNSTYRFNYTNFAQVANNSQTFQSNKSMYGPLSLDFNHFYFESDTLISSLKEDTSNVKVFIMYTDIDSDEDLNQNEEGPSDFDLIWEFKCFSDLRLYA